jgi:trk system potassium uptake protein
VGRDAAAVAHDVGLLLFVPGAMAAVSVPVALLVGEPVATPPLAIAAAACCVLGWGLVHRFRHARALHRWPAIEVVALGWLSCAVVGAAVLWGIGTTAEPGHADTVFSAPVDALFEATSGVTTTGLTVADGQEAALSRTVQWWRSLLQWVGGIGVLLFAAGFGHTAARVDVLYEAEGRSDDVGGDVRHTVRAFVALYAALTAVVVGAFLLTEQPPWVAVNHAMTGLATGGFTVTDDSLAGYGTATLVVAMAVMVAGATSFVFHHLLLVERAPGAAARFTRARAQVCWLAGGAVAVLVLGSVRLAEEDRIHLVFQWVSAATTTGFASVGDLTPWVTLLPLLLVAMVVGASSGSTAGGLKLDRLVWLVKDLVSRVRGSPRDPAPVTWDGREVDDDTRRRSVRHAAEMLVLWVLTLAVGWLIVWRLTGADPVAVLFDVASAQSNVGLDLDVVDGGLPAAAKLTVAALMYLGRLELLAALVLASQREHIDER